MRRDIVFGSILTAVIALSGCVSEDVKDVNEDNTEYYSDSYYDEGENQAPDAYAGEDMAIEVYKSITITGSGSDSDGQIVEYIWTKGDEVLATTESFVYTPTAVGTDTLTFSVIDDWGYSASDDVDIVVYSAQVQDDSPTEPTTEEELPSIGGNEEETPDVGGKK